MNVNIYIENSLGLQLQECATALHKTRNAIIREAIAEWVERHKVNEWPASVLHFKGVPDAPRFESYRDELKKPKDDPLE